MRPMALKIQFDEARVRKWPRYHIDVTVGFVIQEDERFFLLKLLQFSDQILEAVLEHPAITWKINQMACLRIRK